MFYFRVMRHQVTITNISNIWFFFEALRTFDVSQRSYLWQISKHKTCWISCQLHSEIQDPGTQMRDWHERELMQSVYSARLNFQTPSEGAKWIIYRYISLSVTQLEHNRKMARFEFDTIVFSPRLNDNGCQN